MFKKSIYWFSLFLALSLSKNIFCSFIREAAVMLPFGVMIENHKLEIEIKDLKKSLNKDQQKAFADVYSNSRNIKTFRIAALSIGASAAIQHCESQGIMDHNSAITSTYCIPVPLAAWAVNSHRDNRALFEKAQNATYNYCSSSRELVIRRSNSGDVVPVHRRIKN